MKKANVQQRGNLWSAQHPHVTLGTEAVPTMGTSYEGEFVDWAVLIEPSINIGRSGNASKGEILWIIHPHVTLEEARKDKQRGNL